MGKPNKALFLTRVSREMDEDLGDLDFSPQEACALLLQPSILRGTSAYWARRA